MTLKVADYLQISLNCSDFYGLKIAQLNNVFPYTYGLSKIITIFCVEYKLQLQKGQHNLFFNFFL